MSSERPEGDIHELSAAPRNTTNNHDEQLNKTEYMKLISSGYSFFVAGVNDGSIGALLPYLLLSYHLNPATVTTM